MNATVPKAEIHSFSEDAHNKLTNLLKEKMIKHSYHIVDAWGLYSVFHLWTSNPQNYIDDIVDLKLTFVENQNN